MGKLAGAATFITQLSKEMDSDGDELMNRANKLRTDKNTAVSKAHAVIDVRQADIAALESDVQALNSIPFDGDR